MKKYRIYFVGFGGNLYCVFKIGFTSVYEDKPILFSTENDAEAFILDYCEKGREYAIIPVICL